MRPLSKVALTTVACFAVGCGGADNDQLGSDTSFQTEQSVPDPVPGTVDNPLDKALVLEAWQRMDQAFYGPNSSTPVKKGEDGYWLGAQQNAPSRSETQSCLYNFTHITYYSDIVAHFYCNTPSYNKVSPNVRSCFSYISSPQYGHPYGEYNKEIRIPDTPETTGVAVAGPPRKLNYAEAYDYCLYQAYDVVANGAVKQGATDAQIPGLGAYGTESPLWDGDVIAKNKAANVKPGVLSWIDDNMRDAFQHVMFTWYNPNAFKLADQQEVINAFYDVKLKAADGTETYNLAYDATDTVNVDICKNSKRAKAPYDPSDGTHCSSSKEYKQPRENHEKFDEYTANLTWRAEQEAKEATPVDDGTAPIGIPVVLATGERVGNDLNITAGDTTLVRKYSGYDPITISNNTWGAALDKIDSQDAGWATYDDKPWRCQRAAEFATNTKIFTDQDQMCRVEINPLGGQGFSIAVIGLDANGQGLASWIPAGPEPASVNGGAPRPITDGPPNAVNVTMDSAAVAQAMLDLKAQFPNVTNAKRNDCLKNARASGWLDIQAHYYCLLPYNEVRDCYSNALVTAKMGGAPNPAAVAYPQCFESPNANSAQQWVHQNQEAVFKYVNFVKHGVVDFELRSQNTAIDSYYATIQETRPRRVSDTWPAWLPEQPRYDDLRQVQVDAQQ